MHQIFGARWPGQYAGTNSFALCGFQVLR